MARYRYLPDEAREHWNKHRTEGPKIDRILLFGILASVVFGLENNDQEVFVVLDALDEYRLLRRKEVTDWLQEFFEKHNDFHVLVTSRKENDIRECLGDAAKVNVAKYVVQDVQVFIEKSIDEIVQKEPWERSWELRMYERIKLISDR